MNSETKFNYSKLMSTTLAYMRSRYKEEYTELYKKYKDEFLSGISNPTKKEYNNLTARASRVATQDIVFKYYNEYRVMYKRFREEMRSQ